MTVTLIVTGAVADNDPLVPVTVTVYAPAVVPAETTFEHTTVTGAAQPFSNPIPTPSMPTNTAPRNTLRRFTGINSSSSPASAAPPISPVRLLAEFVRHWLYGPADVTEIVAVPVPPAARFSVTGEIAHVGG